VLNRINECSENFGKNLTKYVFLKQLSAIITFENLVLNETDVASVQLVPIVGK
jgi:hypothetical protein